MENPVDDPLFVNLYRIATGGSERGPLYDRGVLSVLAQLQRDGFYRHNNMCGILCLMAAQEQGAGRLLTDAEADEARRFLADNGWSLAEGLQFVGGIERAETVLFRYQREETPTDQ